MRNILSSGLLSTNKNIKIYRTAIVVQYQCKTWPLLVREERRLRVFENRPNREKVTEEWRPHDEELNP